jgi:glutaminyl-tRNA synthetase
MLVEGTKVETKSPNGDVTTRVIPPTVRGWDDPRLFTLVAIRRRGVPSRAILDFVEGLGVTDALTDIEVPRFEAAVRKYLERTVPRLSLILEPVKVIIDDFKEADEKELTVPYDPKGQIPGERKVKISNEIYIDSSDFREEDDPNFFRLAPNKVVGLLNAITIRATSFKKDDSGRVTEIHAVKAEGEKPKAYIHWVDVATSVKVIARQYNQLFNPPPGQTPNNLDWKEGGWADYLNPNSEVSFNNAVIERGLNDLIEKHATSPSASSDDLVRFQAIRTAYFCIDAEKNADGTIVLNQIVSLKEDKAK